ncbi:hypothetical protein IMT69_002133 [Salmonella enterica]|nr:hypothetical protein [Salmonella enterica]EGL7282694.1 hypothetical protein [Salmonella enterica]EGM5504403.1 hypothetical protein [Salmonella enterica]EGM5523180.1 hypothetical protein [Salmonella enterica]EHK6450014.1 hypothetical protein [Salmonella enterica]
MLTCKHCSKETEYLDFVQANIMQSPVNDAWVVDLILACPYCGQQLNLFPAVMDFKLLGDPDEDEELKMNKIQKPVVLFNKHDDDSYTIAITDNSTNYHDSILMIIAEVGEDTSRHVAYYMAAEIEMLRQLIDKSTNSTSPVVIPDGLHSDTALLVMNTANAMAEKLYKAQEKHGYTNGWKVPPDGEETGDGRNFWTREECLKALFQHLEKGDQIDCINYLAFMQANGWRTELPAQSKKREVDNKKTSTMKGEINELSAVIARFFHNFDPEEFSPENSGDRAEKMAAELARYLTETERLAK